MIRKLIKILLLLVFLVVVVFFFLGVNINTKTTTLEEVEISQKAKNMNITSSAFINNQLIPSKYSCDGENINPPLEFEDIPEGTKSLALIVEDPDAPTGTWLHWSLFNIPSSVSGIKENSVPSGAIQGATDFGNSQYGGPCPPSGTHRYFFKLYALDTTLDLREGSPKREFLEYSNNHILGYAELIGLYTRF